MEDQRGLQPLPRPQNGYLQPNDYQALNFPQRILAANAAMPIHAVVGNQRMKETITKVLFLLSVPKESYPDANETSGLMAYINQKWGKQSTESMSLAFEMYIGGMLDIQPDNYIRFGPLLIDRVMQSYIRYSFNILKEAKENDETDPLLNLTEEEKDARLTAGCIEAFAKYKADGRLLDPGNWIWRHLERKEIVNFSRERKEAIRIRAVESNREDLVRVMQGSLTKEEKIKIEARTLALKEFFDDLIKTDTELSELFENI